MKLFNGGLNLGAGLAIGLGAALLTPVVVPIAAAAVRPLVKAGIKGGILLYDRGRVATEEAKETIEDLAAEAKAEMRTGKKKVGGKTAKKTS
jgi:hypothetical protein